MGTRISRRKGPLGLFVLKAAFCRHYERPNNSHTINLPIELKYLIFQNNYNFGRQRRDIFKHSLHVVIYSLKASV